MKYSLDRFEGDFAVLIADNGDKTDIKKEHLPLNVKEGDILVSENGNFVFDKAETETRRMETVKRFNKLFKR